MVKKGKYEPWNFKEEDFEEDDYYYEDDWNIHLFNLRINRELKQREKTMLNVKIKSEFYHTEIKESEEKTIINIYNENPNLSLDLRD